MKLLKFEQRQKPQMHWFDRTWPLFMFGIPFVVIVGVSLYAIARNIVEWLK